MTSSTFTPEDLPWALLVGSVVLLVAVAAVRVSNRSGLPTLLIYLGIGLLLGEQGLGIRFSDASLTQVLGYSALVLILAEGGLSTRWAAIKPAVMPALMLSTVGVLVSVAAVGLFVHLWLDLGWQVSFLLGAIVSSTDAAAVFSVLRKVPLPPRLSGVLEAESGFNDAPVVLLVIALASQAVPGVHHSSWWVVGLEALVELAGGALIGAGIGWALGRLMAGASPGSSGLFSIGIIAVPVLAYAVADLAHTSGFIAVYVCSLVLGNIHLPHRVAVNGFAQALGWIAQIGLFVMLGLLASPSRLVHQLVPALVTGLGLLLIARPLSVFFTLPWFKFSLRDNIFLSWAGLRGAVPVVLATVPATLGTPRTGWIFDLVFVLVVVFTLIQAPTLPWVARLLGIGNDVHTVDVELEATPLDELRASVVQVRVGATSRLHGVEVHELRLPKGCNVTLIVRGDESFVPTPRTAIRRGDKLLIIAPQTAREATTKRLQQLSDHGRMAGWLPTRTVPTDR